MNTRIFNENSKSVDLSVTWKIFDGAESKYHIHINCEEEKFQQNQLEVSLVKLVTKGMDIVKNIIRSEGVRSIKQVILLK